MPRRTLLPLQLLLLAAVAFAGEVRTLSPEEAGYEPYLRYAPRTASGRLDWLLVTPKEFVPAFEPLLRHRRDLGLSADVVTVEEVRRDVLLGGGDLPERLRNLVKLLHERYGLRYLVLAGDSEVLPSRMAPFGISGPKVHHGEPYASDAYFGCLDGEWNADADARIGEAEPGQDDRPDTEHEVHVGRIPVESVREAETYVAKLLLYERPTHTDYQDRIAYLGGKVFFPDDADKHYRKVHEELFRARGLKPEFFAKAGKGAARADVVKALSEGVGIVCHYHHSFTYNLSLPTGAIDTGNYSEIANRERPFVMFSNGCYANQWTKEGISEKLLLSPEGGPVAFLGSTNTCFTSSLALERAFWVRILSDERPTLGEALSGMRAEVRATAGSLGFLRLSLSLLGDPATRPWLGRPARVEFDTDVTEKGALRVTRKGDARGPLRVACVQEGPFGAWREPLEIPAGKSEAVFPAVIGNAGPLRVTVSGADVAPLTKEVPDPLRSRITSISITTPVGLAAENQCLTLTVDAAEVQEFLFPLLDPLTPGRHIKETGVKAVLARGIGTVPSLVRVAVPVLDGADAAFIHDDTEHRAPGFWRMYPRRTDPFRLVADGEARVVHGSAGPGPGSVEAEATDSTIRLTWDGEPGARWLVHATGEDGGRRLLTPVPLVNSFFELTGLAPLSEHRLVVSRLGGRDEEEMTAATSFPFQEGFPQRIGANVTSVQVLDLDGRRGKEVVFGDDKLGLWALHADGSEVRHAGDSWTFGLFAAIESGVFEPVVADIGGSRRPEILATGKLTDRKLHAFRRDGEPVPGFPVSFRSRLMTPPLVGDFDGKKGVEILVVSGFGKTVELVRPDGTKEPYAAIGQYNYGYPIAANLDRDRALEVVILDGQGKVHVLDQGGKEMKGFPVDLGEPGRATPMLADLDGKRGLEIVAVGRGTTRIAVISPKGGKVLADLAIPDAGKPANYSHFYPGLADLGGEGKLSILVGTPSKKLFAFDLVGGKELQVRKGYPLDLPAEARGIAAVDVTGDGRDEVFLSLHNGEVWGLSPEGDMLRGFPLRTKADTYGAPLLEDLDGDGDLELFLGAADGVLRVWDLPYRLKRKTVPTWRGLLNGAGMPGRPGKVRR